MDKKSNINRSIENIVNALSTIMEELTELKDNINNDKLNDAVIKVATSIIDEHIYQERELEGIEEKSESIEEKIRELEEREDND